jgi:glucosamine--fructose-6-phosphate aminotransferase (isomerizing)
MSNPGQIMAQEIAQSPAIITRLLDSHSEFEAIANEIKSRGVTSAVLVARGTSDNAAHFLKYLIELHIGIPVGLASPSSVTIYGAPLHYSKTLVVAISQSGQSPDLLAFTESAKKGGAFVLSMTNDVASPLAKIGARHIDLQAGPEIAVAATKSYTSQLAASLLLIAHWSGNTQLISRDSVRDFTLALEAEPSVLSFVQKLDPNLPIMVLGRGYAYANARELALKIQETSHLTVQGMSSADYLHGPIATLNNSTQLFVFNPSGMPSKAMAESVKRIRQSVDRIIWIGSDSLMAGEDLRIAGSTRENEALSTVVDSITLQQIALHFALKNGFNPDQPAGLNKITRTL